MILTGQRATWTNGEQTLVEDPSRYRKITGLERDLPDPANLFTAICSAMGDMKMEYGLYARALSMTMDEWHRILYSRSFLDTVKYMAIATAKLQVPTPDVLGSMLGIEVRVEGYTPAPKPQPPPPAMNCRNCGAPPKLGSRACVHCGTPWAASGTPTREAGPMPAPRVPLDWRMV